MTTLFLCGLPSCGKTTIGRALSKMASSQQRPIPFFDLDEQIEALYSIETHVKVSCREIYQRNGSDFFRHLEETSLFTLLSFPEPNRIISLGGGTLLSRVNQSRLSHAGHFIYLKAPLSLLYKRMQLRGAPAFLSSSYDWMESLSQIEKERVPLYEKFAQTTIEVENLDVHEVVRAIEQKLLHGKQLLWHSL